MAAAVLAVAAALLTACSAGSAAKAAPAAPTADRYGSLPTFLPSAAPLDRVLTGDAAHPALTVEGDTVHVQLTGGAEVDLTVSGPVVPGEGLPAPAPATTCTWTVSISGVSRAVSLSVADFTTLDHLGTVYKVALVPGQPVPPATLQPGGHVTFELRTVMPTGEGLMRWAPVGDHIVASWDFEVEND